VTEAETGALTRSGTVVELCSELIRIDTTNHGDGRSRGEDEIADHIAGLLRAAGYEPEIMGPTPERASVVVRIPGEDRSLPAILVHAHTDVVPVDLDGWTVPPFGGLIRDGYVWGRGAADMKDMVAMVLATALDWARTGAVPRRDIVLAFVGDEEDRGEHGAGWIVRERPDLLAGVVAAIGESGGTAAAATDSAGRRRHLYAIATAERGTMHMRLTSTGPAGHGSRPVADSAIRRLLDATQRVARHPWPIHLSATVRAYLEQTSAALGWPSELDTDAGIERTIDRLGDAGTLARYTVRASTTPTMLSGGSKVNVIPGHAEAMLDVRCPPGFENELERTIDVLLGDDARRDFVNFAPPVESDGESFWFAAMRSAILDTDPDAIVVPFCMGGGTDAKAFTAAGIQCYGFAPLTLDGNGREAGGVHGVDERVPIDSLEGGQRLLARFLLGV
jgi:acetylornithine deacetylase/succinyl-diaminopimelate desuccinylase-like protein